MASTRTTPRPDGWVAPRVDVDVDVAVIGRHAAANLLAASLAAGGLRVALLAAGDDAPPAPGSDLSTVPYSSELALLMAHRFGLPELEGLALFEQAPAELQQASGIKTNLGFVHHRAHRVTAEPETVQFQVPGEHAEWQPDREAFDAWTERVATTHGARLVDASVGSRSSGPDRVELALDDGSPLTAAMLVDATGLITGAGSRASWRTISTDMTGVVPFERAASARPDGVSLRPWSTGTLTHTFRGGWVQITHRDNHPGCRKPGCGVSLTVAADHPALAEDPSIDPDALLERVLAELPDLQAQLAGAEKLRPWAEGVPGTAPAEDLDGSDPRVLRLDGPGAAREPLLARELTLGLELVATVAAAILAHGPESADALGSARRRCEALVAHHDRWVGAMLGASGSFPLVNALLRVWLLESIIRALALKRERLDARAAGDWSALDSRTGAFWFAMPERLEGLVDATLIDAEAAGAGRLPAAAAAKRIFGRLGKEPIVPPLYDFADPDARVYRFTFARRIRMLVWATVLAPKAFRRLLTAENVSAKRPGS